MWRTPNRQAPDIEFDYRQMAIKVDTRGLGRLAGTLRFTDLEKLPRVSRTFLMQCGAPNPRGIVKWTGVRFSDFADMLGLDPGVHYARFIASDRHNVDEAMTTLRHPQVMLVWMMNDRPLPPRHGAPLRLLIPFRYGNRSIKAITEMIPGIGGARSRHWTRRGSCRDSCDAFAGCGERTGQRGDRGCPCVAVHPRTCGRHTGGCAGDDRRGLSNRVIPRSRP
jgi:hypothetical protein